MPQLDVQDFAPQLIWLAITFIALYVVMARVALPRIATVIEERRDKIADDLDQASRLKREAEEALQAYESALADARARAHAIASETRERLNAEMDREKSEIEAELQGRIDQAEKRIAATKEEAMKNVRSVATEAAQAIVARLTGESVGPSEAERAVDQSLERS